MYVHIVVKCAMSHQNVNYAYLLTYYLILYVLISVRWVISWLITLVCHVARIVLDVQEQQLNVLVALKGLFYLRINVLRNVLLDIINRISVHARNVHNNVWVAMKYQQIVRNVSIIYMILLYVKIQYAIQHLSPVIFQVQYNVILAMIVA
jgi:hypothetical protein